MSTDERRRKENLDADENVGFEPRRDPYSTEAEKESLLRGGREPKQAEREREREIERDGRRTGFIQPPFKNSGTAALGKIINGRPTLGCVTLRKRLSVRGRRREEENDRRTSERANEQMKGRRGGKGEQGDRRVRRDTVDGTS